MDIETIDATIETITNLNENITKLILVPEKFVDYLPGQYLQILWENEAYFFSIANAPLGSKKYELHIRHMPENAFHQQLFAALTQKGKLQLKLPFGECHLETIPPGKPILFIAGGTGFAPIKAMIESLIAQEDPRQFELFWGARVASDLYMHDQLSEWHQQLPQFRYFSSLSHPGKDRLIEQILKEHGKELNKWQIVISGPFEMVYYTRDALLAAGATIENLYSDAFTFNK